MESLERRKEKEKGGLLIPFRKRSSNLDLGWFDVLQADDPRSLLIPLYEHPQHIHTPSRSQTTIPNHKPASVFRLFPSTIFLGHIRPFPIQIPQSIDYSQFTPRSLLTIPNSSLYLVTYDHSRHKQVFLSLLTIPFHDQTSQPMAIPCSNTLGHIRPFPTQA